MKPKRDRLTKNSPVEKCKDCEHKSILDVLGNCPDCGLHLCDNTEHRVAKVSCNHPAKSVNRDDKPVEKKHVNNRLSTRKHLTRSVSEPKLITQYKGRVKGFGKALEGEYPPVEKKQTTEKLFAEAGISKILSDMGKHGFSTTKPKKKQTVEWKKGWEKGWIDRMDVERYNISQAKQQAREEVVEEIREQIIKNDDGILEAVEDGGAFSTTFITEDSLLKFLDQLFTQTKPKREKSLVRFFRTTKPKTQVYLRQSLTLKRGKMKKRIEAVLLNHGIINDHLARDLETWIKADIPKTQASKKHSLSVNEQSIARKAEIDLILYLAGEKCKDYDEDCYTCMTWKCYEEYLEDIE